MSRIPAIYKLSGSINTIDKSKPHADNEDIFFDVDNSGRKMQLDTYIPQTQSGCILITSRNKQAAYGHVIDMMSMN